MIGQRWHAVRGIEPQARVCCASLTLMNTNYSAVVKQDGGWWIGWIEELPGINCQEATREALIESLRITLREGLALNRSEAIQAAGQGYEELAIAI